MESMYIKGQIDAYKSNRDTLMGRHGCKKNRLKSPSYIQTHCTSPTDTKRTDEHMQRWTNKDTKKLLSKKLAIVREWQQALTCIIVALSLSLSLSHVLFNCQIVTNIETKLELERDRSEEIRRGIDSRKSISSDKSFFFFWHCLSRYASTCTPHR